MLLKWISVIGRCPCPTRFSCDQVVSKSAAQCAKPELMDANRFDSDMSRASRRQFHRFDPHPGPLLCVRHAAYAGWTCNPNRLRREPCDSTPRATSTTAGSICTRERCTSASSTRRARCCCTAICPATQSASCEPSRRTETTSSWPSSASSPGTGWPTCARARASPSCSDTPCTCEPSTARRPRTTGSTPTRPRPCFGEDSCRRGLRLPG